MGTIPFEPRIKVYKMTVIIRNVKKSCEDKHIMEGHK